LQDIEAEISRELDVRTQLEAAQDALLTTKAQLDATQERIASVQNAETILREALAQLEHNKHTIAEREREIHEQERKADQSRQVIATLQATLAEESTIAQGYAQLLDMQQKNEQLNAQLSSIYPLRQRESALITDINAERATLERDLASVESTLRELIEQQDNNPHTRLEELTTRISQLNEAEQERTRLQAEIKTLNGQRGELQATQKQLEREGKDLNQRIDNFNTLTDVICPTCGQPISPDHRDHMVSVWNEERETLRATYRDGQQQASDINTTLKNHDTRLTEISDELAQLQYLLQEQGNLTRAKETSEKARKKWMEVSAKQLALQTQLDTQDYAHAHRAELTDVQAQLNEMTYNSDDHEALKRAMQDLSDFENSNRALDDAKKLLPKEREILAGVEERIKRLQHDLNTLQTHNTNLQETLPVYEDNLSQYRDLNLQLKRDNSDYVNASNNVSNLKQELSAIESKKERRLILEKERDAKVVLAAQYRELAAAFGKNGVPAMIIESAIPELEVTANDLLNRMTEGRMHLRLTTQAVNQDGTTRETLDIEIADELGTRNYEMYSGGEAFRINFALRIALSKMLARRAGAHLQTLFIDEGFGTQDEDGRAKLVEAINVVQSDFDMILVITHMEDLRDSFPVHIVVEKTPRGSVWGLR
jgi:exonuclease SbcC